MIFFVDKMREAFAEASHIFSTKNTGIFEILTFEILMKCQLIMSLVLNNRALDDRLMIMKGCVQWNPVYG